MTAAAPAPAPQCDRALKVTSLIDFDECNVADPSDYHTDTVALVTGDSADVISQEVVQVPAANCEVRPKELDLLSEIELLPQRLKDAEEEKNIQLLIAHDEVAQVRLELQKVSSECNVLKAELEVARSEAACGPAVPPPTERSTSALIPVAKSHAAAFEALKDVRLQAESQVEWITNRMKLAKSAISFSA